MNATTNETIVMAMDSPNIRKITVERPFLHHRVGRSRVPLPDAVRQPDAAPVYARRGIMTWLDEGQTLTPKSRAMPARPDAYPWPTARNFQSAPLR